jgi:hypothetical protein
VSAEHRLELTSDALAIIQDGLAALRGLYEMEANYGRQDLRSDMMKRLCAVEEAAQSIKDQTSK